MSDTEHMIGSSESASKHADVIIGLVDEEIARHTVPPSVTTLAEIGEYIDGLPKTMPDDDGSSPLEYYSSGWWRLVIREVEYRLRMRQIRDAEQSS